jgi:hypothetical protein
MQSKLISVMKLSAVPRAISGARNITVRLLLPLLISACSAFAPPAPAPAPVRIPAPAVGEVNLIRSPVELAQYQLLDIGIVIFDNLPDQFALQRPPEINAAAFTEIRQNETQYLPYVLRNTLIDSNHWGAVRVLPENDPSVDLIINGTIVVSDGLALEIQITAVDSTGLQWLNKTYADISYSADFPVSSRYTASNRFDPAKFVDPFQDLYDQINNDLLSMRNSLGEKQLVDLRQVSQMVYASDLAPESFGHTLSENPAGFLSVSTLLADDDPMMRRMFDMRLRHHTFIDTVDQYYAALFDEMRPVYATWRHYSHDQLLEDKAAERNIYEGDVYGNAGRFLTLSQRYDRYRWAKIYELEFADLATGFNNEIAPAILELNRNVHGLDGTMSDQYAQWKKILRSLFALEVEQAGSR